MSLTVNTLQSCSTFSDDLRFHDVERCGDRGQVRLMLGGDHTLYTFASYTLNIAAEPPSMNALR